MLENMNSRLGGILKRVIECNDVRVDLSPAVY